MKHLLLILSIFLFTSPLFCQETGVLFQYKISSGFVWKTFGKGKVQPKYEGEVSAGIPEGFGILSYPFTDGKSVVGEWKDGKEWNTEHFSKEGIVLGIWENGKWILKWGVLFERMGNGILVWSENGNEDFRVKYVGDIENMKPKGQGTITSPDGDKYEGEFKNGKKHGQGTLTTPDGYSYTGRWNEGNHNGLGTETFSNRDKYVGEFKNGKKHGQGTFTSNDGDKYEGEFKNGKKHGKGTLTSPDGSMYIGTFKSGKKNGKGKFTSPDGRKFVGEYKDDKKHGKGTFTWSDEGKYEGKWKDGKFNGQGTFTFSDGNKGVGEFRDNKPWNITTYDKDGNYKWKYVKGVRR